MTRLRELIGASLRRHRHAQGRTLREVAGTAGISLTYLSEIERGRKEPSSEVLAALSAALGVVLSEVLREVADRLAHLEAARARTPVGFLPYRPTAPRAAAAAPDRAARVVDLHAQPAGSDRTPTAVPHQPPAGEPPAAQPAGRTSPRTARTDPSSQRPTARVLDFQAYAARRSA